MWTVGRYCAGATGREGDIAGALSLEQFPVDRVARWLTEGKLIPFIGAGASRAGISSPPPDGKGLAKELVAAMAGAFPGAAEEDLAKVAQFYEHTLFDREALYEYLHDRFERQQLANDPNAVATMLARIPRSVPLFLITTNYDTAIERAFEREGRPLCVITQNMRDPGEGTSGVNVIEPGGKEVREASVEFQWNDPARFPPDCGFLFKMHGSVRPAVPKVIDDVIITEDDYVDFMVNSGGSVSPFFPPASLTAQYKQRRFLFLGYSLYDWNFRAFLRVLALRNALSGREALRHFAVQLNPDELDVELWKHRNVNVYNGDLSELCRNLDEALEAHRS